MTTPAADDRFRTIISKAICISIMAELAEEQTWRNFKRQTALHQGKDGGDYLDAVHDVWLTMYQAPAR